MQKGTVSTNLYLRRVHNFALDMNWLPASVIPKRQWPTVRYKEKRAIAFEEHQTVITAEVNPERKVFYQLYLKDSSPIYPGHALPAILHRIGQAAGRLV